ncbi:glycosyl transferase, group 2 family protein [Clostridium pasteurianum DSM 525 = ATCC 6013]|uniref:Glycosyl transferase family 2 n=1 Tax=Clostridium pasteurianum DSM 525 = ATCC 6013 TaxID=1262449 RepID=A0A0H3J5X5_CLOPA|nr:glycosyltransferase family 2 protein [Clostridium pasteurianum]AJA46330.1 glycosyl transferase, group 2 family protein [Clostridium pasteurianum DSM 525 = ATCC 6013]AJA50318.1 glycosyl transferase, group 2 family protein [Clostridium pasteurianum DSM 525 = ATCC 6013]AOZ77250.1 glycosyltransferase [Clostridium pasteurianum DSM 525 = ATCC 6013]AOZ81047.1 glycosyltransferase [Clostridium pasteurianum]KRU13670.1 glycosyl transferase family 2 [Clostridium pasteurianum DSM 525 = ATCC 6013]
MEDKAVYSVVVPLYNEELVINETYKKLTWVMDCTKENYEIVFINDGSKDSTKSKVQEICREDSKIKLVNFSRNFGHQAAITAGMNIAEGAAIIVIDADLQDPPEVILKMIGKWKEGYEVVYGKRVKREGETFFKKFTSMAFYRVLKSMTTIDIPVDTGDFRLIDRKVRNALELLPEKNRYVRGLVSWVGYKQTFVEFVRRERFAGESKYPLSKMMKLAFDGITAFSYKPLIFSAYIGVISLFIGIILFIGVSIRDLIKHISLLNISFILSINLIMCGFILISMGILGQYIGRIMDETKDRPLYIVDNIINYKNTQGRQEIKYIK